VTECNETFEEWCRHMTRLKGLVVYLFRNHEKVIPQTFYKVVSNYQSAELPYQLIRIGIPKNHIVLVSDSKRIREAF
jgi:hypothetical protein